MHLSDFTQKFVVHGVTTNIIDLFPQLLKDYMYYLNRALIFVLKPWVASWNSCYLLSCVPHVHTWTHTRSESSDTLFPEVVISLSWSDRLDMGLAILFSTVETHRVPHYTLYVYMYMFIFYFFIILTVFYGCMSSLFHTSKTPQTMYGYVMVFY